MEQERQWHHDPTAEQPAFFHQVIVPVYLPGKTGYFVHGHDILALCMESLVRTVHQATYITVVNNGSDAETRAYLESLHASGRIHELIHTPNIGKVNAVAKGLAGHAFPLVTIADADVLFINGWQQATYEIYEAFPKAGAVGTTPLSQRSRELTANIVFDHLFSPRLRFSPVREPEAMKEFLRSIGNPGMLSELQLSKCLTLCQGTVEAVIGSGHFVCTYRRDILGDPLEMLGSNLVGGSALRKFFDAPVVRKGFYRLSTARNFTYHMGNVPEAWMHQKLAGAQRAQAPQQPVLRSVRSGVLAWIVKTKLFYFALARPAVWKKILRLKGLSKQEVEAY